MVLYHPIMCGTCLIQQFILKNELKRYYGKAPTIVKLLMPLERKSIFLNLTFFILVFHCMSAMFWKHGVCYRHNLEGPTLKVNFNGFKVG